MSNVIKIKRGRESKLPSSLADGELALTTDSYKLYAGIGGGITQINNNTTYKLTKSGSTVTLTGSDGTTTSVTDSNTTYSTATTSANGLMSSADKTKLDGIASGAQVNNVVVSTAQPTASTAEVWINPNGQIDLSGLWNSVYPVGAIYMSASSTNPSTLFPGTTWTALTDRFLVGAGSTYSGGATGGHKDLQSHTHSIPALSGTAASAGSHNHLVTSKTTTYAQGTQSSWRCLSWTGTNADYSQDVYSGDSGAHTHSVTTTASTSGSTGAGNGGNLPPYLAVYMWKRTA